MSETRITDTGAQAASEQAPIPASRTVRTVRSRVVRFLGRGDGDVARVLVLLLLVAVLGAVAPSFISKASWLAFSQTATVVALLGIGQTFVIVTAGIDLSVGAVMAATAIIGASVMRNMHAAGMEQWLSILAGLVVMLALGTLAGMINGVVITKLRITPFIVTLGMLSVATGTMNLVSGGAEVVGFPPAISALGNRPVGDWFTIPVLVTVVVAIVAGLGLTRTRFGLRSFAIGSSSGAARRAGITVDAHLVRVYALSGFLAGLAGFLLTSRFSNASPLSGQGMELLSIAAAVIGGASLMGGRGSIIGTMVGASVMAALEIGLVVAGVQAFWQTIVIGIITVAAVFGDQVRIKYSTMRS